MVEFVDGILKIANLLLALVAGGLAISLFNATKAKNLRAWHALIIALVFFGVQMILGALRAFGIYESQFLTHINPSIILAFLIVALLRQIDVNRGKA